MPFLVHDLREKFSFLSPFEWALSFPFHPFFRDPHGKIALAEKQRLRLKGWMRPSEFLEEPTVIKDVDSGTIKQTVISDCSFVSSLSIAARYERRFGKRLVTRYPLFFLDKSPSFQYYLSPGHARTAGVQPVREVHDQVPPKRGLEEGEPVLVARDPSPR